MQVQSVFKLNFDIEVHRSHLNGIKFIVFKCLIDTFKLNSNLMQRNMTGGFLAAVDRLELLWLPTFELRNAT